MRPVFPDVSFDFSEHLFTGTQLAHAARELMFDRRGAQRFVFAQPAVGRLRLIYDVLVTHIDAERAIAVASGPVARGLPWLLEVPTADGGAAEVPVRVVSMRAVLDDNRLRRRVHLQLVRRDGNESTRDGHDLDESLLAALPIVGALVRRVPLRLLEVSASGCLFDSQARIDDGTVGFVDVGRSTTTRHTEVVRTRRSGRVEGHVWPYRTAASFLALGPASPSSLRVVATAMALGWTGSEVAAHQLCGPTPESM